MEDNKQNRMIEMIDWFIDTFLTSKKEKEMNIQEKKDTEKELAETLAAKKELIKKFNLIEKIRYGSNSPVIEVSQQDFKKILVEEKIEKIYTYTPQSARDFGRYDLCPYYFIVDGVRIVTYGSMGDNGFFQYFFGPLFDKSNRNGKEEYDQNILEYVSVIPISNKELRDYLEKEKLKT